MIELKTNKVNTDLDEQLLKSLTKEERETVLDYISGIVFLQNLVSPTRKYARDLERWDHPNNDMVLADGTLERKLHPKGRVRVDLANPHILEDTDYFREAAIHFETHGVYTTIKPNKNPYSDYRKFWDTQIERCWEGMVRESDGEWITGYHYFYLNFSPVMKSVRKPGTRRYDRVEALPDFYDGDYWFFHYITRSRDNGKHSGGLKKRGAGYSLKGASMLGRNFIVGESKEVSSKVRSIAIANEKEYLTKDGILNKFTDVSDFCSRNTPFPNRKELKDSWQSMHWQMGWKNTEAGINEGSLNEVMGVTLKNDPEKARGKRAQFILWEEFGKFDNSIKAWNIGRPSTEDGEAVFGQMVFWGTGGTATEAFAGLREIFYNPKGYNVYELDNVWDKNSKRGSTCAFFHPGYLNQVGYMDKDGNSDVVMSLLSVIKKRIDIKYNSTEASSLPQMVSEMALTPQEAIMKVSGSIFPTVDIRDYLEECRININKFTSTHLVGDLVINSAGEPEFKANFDKSPIRTYNRDKNNVEGAIEIFALPQIDRTTKKPYYNRYIAGIDPVDNDYVKTGSLASIFIFDLWNDEIVAEYTGRPQLADDFYEICRRLLIFYNAQGNYENNIKGLFGYFNNKSCLHLLCDTPSYLRDVEEQKQNLFGNRAHPYSEYLYTPKGKIQWKDINIGDEIFGDDGEITKVTDIPFNEETDIYKITLHDGRDVLASENHIWSIYKDNYNYKTLHTTKEMLYDFKRERTVKNKTYYSYKYAIPNNKAIEFKKQDIKIDPYTLGLLIGDGCFTQSSRNRAMIASCKEDMNFYKTQINFPIESTDNDRHWRIIYPEFKTLITELNLEDKKSNNKFIPDIYKYNTKEIRLSILQGLMDSDGHVGDNHTPKFSTTSKQLADDVMFICRSLGYNCKTSEQKAGYKKNGVYKKCNNVYNVIIWTSDPIFRLERKLNKLKSIDSKKRKWRKEKMNIINIEFSHREKAKCITVDNKSSCYLINEFITTHNSKGTRASEGINNDALRLQKTWMLTPRVRLDENENEIKILTLRTIRSLGYLEELYEFNSDGNFDRVSAMGMVMILRQDRFKITESLSSEKNEDYIEEDKFIKDNYDSFIEQYKNTKEKDYL